jgi:steroid delta-isomerase-like uncharacterized protein
MTRDDAKTLVSAYIDAVWNNADFTALDELTRPTFTYHLGGQPGKDKAAMRQFLMAVHAAFPDWKVHIEAIVAEGDTVAARWTGRVTHQGPFQGIPPTGREVSVSGINFYVIEEGKISREWEQMDSLGLLQQLGVIPAPKT